MSSCCYKAILNSSTICLARTLLTATSQITARPVDTSQLHLAPVKAQIQRWLEYSGCALRGKLCGLLFHAVTKTCAPFAKASCVKTTKTLPNASSVMDLWSDGLPFTDLEKIILTILYPSRSYQGEGKPNRRLFSERVGVVTRACVASSTRLFLSGLQYMRYFDMKISAQSCSDINWLCGTGYWTLVQWGVALSKCWTLV